MPIRLGNYNLIICSYLSFDGRSLNIQNERDQRLHCHANLPLQFSFRSLELTHPLSSKVMPKFYLEKSFPANVNRWTGFLSINGWSILSNTKRNSSIPCQWEQSKAVTTANSNFQRSTRRCCCFFRSWEELTTK